MKIQFDSSVKMVKVWKNKEHTDYGPHYRISLLKRVLKQLPPDIWIFDIITIGCAGMKDIILKGVLKITNKNSSYFTIPVHIAESNNLGEKDVKVTLQW